MLPEKHLLHSNMDHDSSSRDIEKHFLPKLSSIVQSRSQRRGSKKLPNLVQAAFFISSLLIVPHLTAADVSVAPNKNLIDLSWPYNEKTIAWVDFRNFSMEIVVDGERKMSDGETIW